jgi:RimJ/RimL family protein N-acetyltransferase
VVKEGLVIGQTGFNAFPHQPSLTEPTRKVLVADVSVLIDYRFTREGYATETLSALIEYGFGELEVGMITLETQAVNQPMRNLLRTMGLGDGAIRGHGSEAEAIYLFGRGTWEEAKREMKLKGKWHLA